jgi:hypothetical protein
MTSGEQRRLVLLVANVVSPAKPECTPGYTPCPYEPEAPAD